MMYGYCQAHLQCNLVMLVKQYSLMRVLVVAYIQLCTPILAYDKHLRCVTASQYLLHRLRRWFPYSQKVQHTGTTQKQHKTWGQVDCELLQYSYAGLRLATSCTNLTCMEESLIHVYSVKPKSHIVWLHMTGCAGKGVQMPLPLFQGLFIVRLASVQCLHCVM